MGGDVAALVREAVDVAHAVVRGEDAGPRLLRTLAEVADCDSGAGLTHWRAGGRGVLPAVNVLTRPLTRAQVVNALRLVHQHPGLRLIATGHRGALRVSDVVEPMRFWDTEAWDAFHRPTDGRFPLGMSLSDSRHIRFVGLQRSARDFTDAEVDMVDRALQPVAAAYRYRGCVEDAIEALPIEDQVREVLTLRQQEVLALVARGYADRRIGAVLGISERTVRKHLADARERTHSSNRAAAAAWWMMREADGPCGSP